jgi:all-trans-retinol dehydrogenase (NAD+)
MIRCFMLIAACAVLHTARHRLLSLAGVHLPLSNDQAQAAHWYLTWSFTLWAIIEFNAILNRWADNKWLWKNDLSEWDWKNEVAVVTGGSQGIGACVVQALVSYGVRCAVLDVAPLSENFSKGVPYFPVYVMCTELTP